MTSNTRFSTGFLLICLFLTGLMLRLWGIRHGLPFSYHYDEHYHYVPRALKMLGGDLDPHYYDNPTTIIYLFYGVYRLFGIEPLTAFLPARLVVALLASFAVFPIYALGKAYSGKATGLIAAALVTCGTLPVFYAHLALTDSITLLPVAAFLWCSLRYWREGATRHMLGAGAALGAAVSCQYLAGACLISFFLAALFRTIERRARFAHAFSDIALVVAVGIFVFAALNPFAAAHYVDLWTRLMHQSAHAHTAKPGQDVLGLSYYGKTLLWAIGIVPVMAMVIGLMGGVIRNRQQTLILFVFPLFLYVFLSSYGRFFARWYLPAYPVLYVLAAYGIVQLVRLYQTRFAGAQWCLMLLLVALYVQPLLYTLHSDYVLSNPYTWEEARSWLKGKIPKRDTLLVEYFAPNDYIAALRKDGIKVRATPMAQLVRVTPWFITHYRDKRICWIMISSYQRDRLLQEGSDEAIDYYQRLENEADNVATFSPYRANVPSRPFDFDFTFNFLPLVYARPGPLLAVYHLRDCR